MYKIEDVYTDEEIRQSAYRHKTQSKWYELEPQYVNAARRRGPSFFKECTAHFPRFGHNARWRSITDDQMAQFFARYKTKIEAQKADGYLYQAARRRGADFFAKITSHMIRQFNTSNEPYTVYVFEFSDKSAYVGLTHRLKRRAIEHKSRGLKSKVTQYKSLFKILAQDLPPDQAQKLEVEWRSRYEQDGWTILNKAKCGNLGGGVTTTITRLEAKQSASKFSNKGDWSSTETKYYRYALAQGKQFFDECTSHMPKVRNRYDFTHEEILSAASKCDSKTDFRRKFPRHWFKAYYNVDKTVYAECTELFKLSA